MKKKLNKYVNSNNINHTIRPKKQYTQQYIYIYHTSPPPSVFFPHQQKTGGEALTSLPVSQSLAPQKSVTGRSIFETSYSGGCSVPYFSMLPFLPQSYF